MEVANLDHVAAEAPASLLWGDSGEAVDAQRDFGSLREAVAFLLRELPAPCVFSACIMVEEGLITHGQLPQLFARMAA
jgi:hypothetical protein